MQKINLVVSSLVLLSLSCNKNDNLSDAQSKSTESKKPSCGEMNSSGTSNCEVDGIKMSMTFSNSKDGGLSLIADPTNKVKMTIVAVVDKYDGDEIISLERVVKAQYLLKNSYGMDESARKTKLLSQRCFDQFRLPPSAKTEVVKSFMTLKFTGSAEATVNASKNATSDTMNSNNYSSTTTSGSSTSQTDGTTETKADNTIQKASAVGTVGASDTTKSVSDSRGNATGKAELN